MLEIYRGMRICGCARAGLYMKLGIYMQPGMRMQSRDAQDANGGPATSAGRQCGKRGSRNPRDCAGSTKQERTPRGVPARAVSGKRPVLTGRGATFDHLALQRLRGHGHL